MSGPIVSYAWKLNSAATIRPDVNYGTNFTVGAGNAKGSTVQVLSSAQVAHDVYFLEVLLHRGDVSLFAHAMLIDIMVDPAGGTAWVPRINNLAYTAGSGLVLTGQSAQYAFPIFIKAGSSIGIRGQREAVATAPCNAAITVCGRPNDAANCPVGSRVVTYGAVTATSRGTVVTSGTTSEGAWTLLGTVAAGDYPWYWQVGALSSDTSTNAVVTSFDLGIGDGTNKFLVSQENIMFSTTAEQAFTGRLFDGAYYQAKPGDGVYGRMQCSGTADSDLTMIAYGLI